MEEIEAKFLDIVNFFGNLNNFRKLIKKNGGKKVHKMVMYKRYVFNLLDPKVKGYIRTREENGRVTITSGVKGVEPLHIQNQNLQQNMKFYLIKFQP